MVNQSKQCPWIISRKTQVKGFQGNLSKEAHPAYFLADIVVSKSRTISNTTSLEGIQRGGWRRLKNKDLMGDSSENRFLALLNKVVDESEVNLNDGAT